ncbi:PQQ-binding-like beta-propeller repeat protein [Natronolimnobius sp. AArcel1]|uniref:PQQ-binding-like beta-propeller repeat protein n=1 Tax=Natronolimnobius sp. AArcel1 TaxID=1679093 RepID=UPI0013EB435C|nr:PQQ-binding-like beta-propeller repeat protein [Natronolimnobius sp. AArcel1]NGM68089.1 PQQ-binding-like beta-propeller repeat protein [Natronolimnobius sp. AArcel1]
MPSRRQVIASGGLSLVAIAGGARAVDGPISIAAGSDFDWPMARFDAAGTATNPDASGPVEGPQVKWERDLDASVKGPAPATLVGDTLFVVGRSSIAALDRETGRVRFERDGYSYLSAPTVAEASAYRTPTLAITGNEGVYGLSAGGGYGAGEFNVGLQRWHAPGSPPPIRTSANPHEPSPVAADGTIYAAIPDSNRIVALDSSSGRLEWEYATNERSGGVNRPAVRDGTVYVTTRPDHVAALDAATGDIRWTTLVEPLEPEREHDYRQCNPPTATERGLVVPSRRAVTLLDPDDGSIEWEYVHDGAASDGSVAVADGTVYATDGEDELHAIDIETGEQRWTAEYAHDVHPVVADGVVYLTYFWLYDLVAIDAESGERRWTYELEAGPSQPIVGDGVLYVVAHNRIVALEEGQ